MDSFFSQIMIIPGTNVVGVPVGTLGSCIFITAASVAVVFGLKQVMNRKSQKMLTKPLPQNAAAQEDAEERKQKMLEERKPALLWNTAMFFPDYRVSDPDSTTQQFLWYFSQARSSIRICIYNLSFPELTFVLAQQYERGLIVQFVVGHEMTADQLRLKCLPCGLIPKDANLPTTDKLMHHKFAIIDDEAVLTGSMNWTVEGVLNNKENVCVSTNPRHVEKCLKEFFKLLRICEDAKTSIC
ncbi:Mitochondrial cardiolipin hydrolase [Orchesella cincta]|uniref:Mitochondrial cardiolipin hydrolase n=1 Tax=Orchesella cincta TaxID=48709 RepID=A0A1D2NC41_ORCCI|nr:Mitochondrial cardiolipin hydrolase [Orchesella cincta]